MTQRLYDSLGLPDSCHLGKRVFKKLFDENAELSAGDRKALADDVDTITWQYTLKPSTIRSRSGCRYREYHEVAVLEAGLKGRAKAARLAEVIHRAIPYPVVLILSDSVGLPTSDGTTAQATQHAMLSLATKRLSRAEKNAIVADGFNTDWLDLAAPTPVQTSSWRVFPSVAFRIHTSSTSTPRWLIGYWHFRLRASPEDSGLWLPLRRERHAVADSRSADRWNSRLPSCERPSRPRPTSTARSN